MRENKKLRERKETMDYKLINDISARFDISEDEAKRIAETVYNEKQFVEVWENETFWTDENNAKSFRIWFQDGSTVPETYAGQNIIASVEELRKLAKQYSFNADEVLNDGETKMLDEGGGLVGGVVTQ